MKSKISSPGFASFADCFGASSITKGSGLLKKSINNAICGCHYELLWFLILPLFLGKCEFSFLKDILIRAFFFFFPNENTVKVCSRLMKKVPYSYVRQQSLWWPLGGTISWSWTVSLVNVLSCIGELYLYGGRFYCSGKEILWLQSFSWNFRSSVSCVVLMPRST